MKILKFGGTSVGTIESLRQVKRIVEGIGEQAIVVVSALGGLTDQLILTAHKAASADCSYKGNVDSFRKRHHDIIEALVPQSRKQEVLETIDSLLGELSNIYDGIALISDVPDKTLDTVVSFGERMSSVIVSNIVEGARHFNSPDFIKTEKWFNRNIAVTDLTERLIRQTFGNMDCRYAVAGGFISTDRDSGDITNLGRGGSDYTAALIAAALDADILEIWTDVDGFMTADPRIIPGARVIDRLSYIESMELCSFGAKVVYPPTIYPVFHKNIPIKILNTFNPEAPGTLICDPERGTSDSTLKGVTTLKGVVLISIEGRYTENLPDVNSRSFNAMAKQGISVLLVSQPEPAMPFSFVVRDIAARDAIKALENEFAPEIEAGSVAEVNLYPDKTILALVGENITRHAGIDARIINTLQRENVAVHASSRGASSTTYSFVVDASQSSRALALVHETFFEERTDE